MDRRDFIKNTVLCSTGLMLFSSDIFSNNSLDSQVDILAKYFQHPPDSARPWCFWMWMNGNITKDGITADLETMKKIGIGGVINFNSAVGIPRGEVDYASDEWMECTAHAIREANRLGIEFSLHNSPGYSGCGGPWVTPEMSMQQLVWQEVFIKNTDKIDQFLPKPYAKFDYYKDAFVLAYPSLPCETILMKDALKSLFINGEKVDVSLLMDKNPETKIRLESGSILLEFAENFTARAISLFRKAEIPHDLFDGPRDHPPQFKVEYSMNNIDFQVIGMIRCPELREMDTPAVLSFEAVSAKYFRLTASVPTWISDIEFYNAPRLAGWSGKTNFTHGDSSGETPFIEKEYLIDSKSVLNISSKMTADGRLVWQAPTKKNWTILRIGHTSTGEECAAHPEAGKGLEIDKFSKEALQFHFDHFLDKFIERVKPFVGKSFKGILVDSWEAGKQNWTTHFPAEFRQRKQYDIIQWLPALMGKVVDSTEQTERFLWDVNKVQADLLADNFYGHYQHLCHQRGLSFYAEPYGDGNLDSLQIGQHLDITMSEFWTRYIYGSDNYSKLAVSAAHIYGKRIVAAEAFTAMPATAKWTDYPYSLKAEGDYFFSLGVNRLVFHTFVHQPYFTGFPGMTMGPFGTHFDRNNTWTNQAYGWTDYLKRCQYLLQQGLTVSDICYFKGDNPESGVPDIYKIIPTGFKGDVIGTKALHQRVSIKNGIISLPDGVTYQLCIMANLTKILPETLARLIALVEAGMTLIVTNKPSKLYGLKAQYNTLIDDFYGDLDGNKIQERKLGKGKILWNHAIKTVLNQLSILPDFEYLAENSGAAIHYIHKRIVDCDIYFVANHKRQREKITCTFRITDRQAEIWNAETGEITEALFYQFTEDGRTQIAVDLAPASSVFVVFSNKKKLSKFTNILKDGKVISGITINQKTNYHTVTNNFSVALWCKPDTFAHNGRSMLFHASEGELLFGKSHAICALSAGQNGVIIYERSRGVAQEIFFAEQSLSGWTYLVLVYANGKPKLFINGKEVISSIVSPKTENNIIHAGLETPAHVEQFASYFEGNYTQPILFERVLNQDEIAASYQKGLPNSTLPSEVKLSRTPKGKLKALFFENGSYALTSKNTKKILGNIQGCRIIELSNNWELQFLKDSEISPIVLPKLMSLHKHENFEIKHFAGTVTYRKNINLSKDDLAIDKRLFLHLGRVEVIAEVSVNMKKVALLWKEPFMTDITDVVKIGKNELIIQVTTLMPNRLVGDEYLPVENEYSKHYFIKKLPEWYVNNQEKLGKRKLFSVWKTHKKTDPLLESGLLGDVKLFFAIEKSV